MAKMAVMMAHLTMYAVFSSWLVSNHFDSIQFGHCRAEWRGKRLISIKLTGEYHQ
jgi:ABC-type uncharacterized transport system permease subunit